MNNNQDLDERYDKVCKELYEQASDKFLIQMYAEALEQNFEDINLENEINSREKKLEGYLTSLSMLKLKRSLKKEDIELGKYDRKDVIRTEEEDDDQRVSESLLETLGKSISPIDELEGEFHRRKFNNDNK